jgi:hypothetical protein
LGCAIHHIHDCKGLTVVAKEIAGKTGAEELLLKWRHGYEA